jgi:hypothetical protein
MQAHKLLLVCFIFWVPLIQAACPSYAGFTLFRFKTKLLKVDTRKISGIVRDVWGCGDKNLPGAVNIQDDYYSCGQKLDSGGKILVC